jgi:hypothetical protein
MEVQPITASRAVDGCDIMRAVAPDLGLQATMTTGRRP